MTRAAGAVSRTPRMPSIMPAMMKGTKNARNGVWWPTMAAMFSVCSRVRPPTSPAVVIGMATAPNATGAVLAISTIVAARSGLMPRARIMVAVMATGAPKPARASSSPPKQNAMSMAWMRTSPWPILSNTSRKSSKRPEATVIW